MKIFTLLILGLITGQLAYGQSTEYFVHLNSGFAAYRGGTSAKSGSVILVPDPYDVYLRSDMEEAYTDNPYGTSLGLSYGLATQVQRVTAVGNVFGLQAGYEVLRSRVQIHNVFDQHDFGIPSTGYTVMANHCFTAHPFFGHRFAVKSMNLDLTAGPEIGFLRRSYEKGKAKTNYSTYTTSLNHAHPKLDVRVRINLTTYYKHVGMTVGYSLGLTNYRKAHAGVIDEAYLQIFRLGLSYQI